MLIAYLRKTYANYGISYFFIVVDVANFNMHHEKWSLKCA